MRRLRNYRTVATVTALALSLTACGFGGDDGGDSANSIDLLVPAYSDGTKALWEGIIKDFEAENPDINVNLEVQSWENINDVVSTKIQSDEAPDILNIDAFAGFAGDDLLYPVEDVASQEVIDNFQPSFRDNASIDGTMYGMPILSSARTLFANTDLMEQAGVDEIPTTWEELLAASTAISELGDENYGYGMPLGSEEAQGETSIWVFGAGGSWGDGNELTIDTPESNRALDFMKTMVDDGATQPDPGATQRADAINLFIEGKLGFIEALPQTIGQIAENNPELNYELAPIPTMDGNPVTLGVADHLMAFKNDGDKADAIKAFLDFYYLTDAHTNFLTTEGFLPVTEAGLQEGVNPDFKVFVDALPDAKFYPSTNPQWSAAQGAMQQQVGGIAQGESVADVLAEIADLAAAS